MSSNKYANLPDIDTAADVYETEDVLPEALVKTSDDHEEEVSRSSIRAQETFSAEDIDSSGLMNTDHALDKFRRAERHSRRTYYAYPPSPTDEGPSKTQPFPQRLQQLQASLSALEDELASSSNPELYVSEQSTANGEPDTAEIIRGLADLRGRLNKIKKGKEGRGKLVSVLTTERVVGQTKQPEREEKENKKADEKPLGIVEMDKRIRELETVVGSSNVTLDELTPLPPPLLPLLMRLNNQLTLLTQPRHIDSVSRRLKLLLGDLDRVAASQKQAQKDNQRLPGANPTEASPSPQLTEQLLPLLTRLGPSLPHISHVLARLRTLSALHAHASEFQETIENMEEEQRKMNHALKELSEATKTVEESLEDNRSMVKNNVEGLEERIMALMERLDKMGH